MSLYSNCCGVNAGDYLALEICPKCRMRCEFIHEDENHWHDCSPATQAQFQRVVREQINAAKEEAEADEDRDDE